MRAVERKSGLSANDCSDNSVGETAPSDNSVGEDCGWFTYPARILLAPKPGLVLDLLTGCGERNGDRYAGGQVKPPGYLIRSLLRSDQGGAWLSAFMDGSAAPWWRQMRDDADYGRKVRNIK